MEPIKPYRLYAADSGMIRFDILNLSEGNIELNIPHLVELFLCTKVCQDEIVVKICFNFSRLTIAITLGEGTIKRSKLPFDNIPELSKYWLSFKHNQLQIGLVGELPFSQIQMVADKLIGYVKLSVTPTIKFVMQSPSVNLKPLKLKHFVDGELHWVNKKKYPNELPPNAFIGGFQNGEFLYVAQAKHNGSVCPGKYVPSKQCAFVPWGRVEHKKNQNFKILCGYNAIWVKCYGDSIPENAFEAGTSEVNNETLYIGRARLKGDLIVGKIHMLYRTCYLPYDGREVEQYIFEILVRANVKQRAETINKQSL